MKILYKSFFLILFFLIISCKDSNPPEKELAKKESTEDTKIFSQVSAAKSGIDFSNNLTENDSLNYFTYSYIYMGGGVSTGDINNDGLPDLYFTGNQVPNKLYLNKGNMEFEDITESAGVAGDERWYTGVTMADVNADGFLDIYLSVGGKFQPKNNQLFINNGDGTFTEKAKEYGLDDAGNSVQATFFDYDKDGDLDVYIANYPPTRFDAPNFVYEYQMKAVTDLQTDHLMRNDGGKFTDVTNEAGVRSFGLTLSATVGDLNNDGWPDLYISNDFSSPDYMYINNGEGSFREVVKDATSHTSFYGMGVDIADYNNDGLLDIYQVDMSAKKNRRKKANMASMNPDLFWGTVEAGFHYQYMQNVLQTNTGVFNNNTPFFADQSRIAGAASTDWSWGPLFADFDNDGHKDLFVTNGTRREINNNDYFNELKNKSLTKEDRLEKSLNIPSEKIDNFIFQNNGDLSFTIANEKWGIEYEGFSNGVVYVDLDNDGDLEIITNNIDDNASVFENQSSERNNYVQIKLEGPEKNKFGLGSRAYITANDTEQMQELTLSRGFQSSVAPQLHFGLAKADLIDKIRIVWPDGKVEIREDVEANQFLSFNYKDASAIETPKELKPETLFSTITDSTSFPAHKHIENEYDDFKDEVLLPHRTSTFGPGIAVGDLNGDGKEDFIVGGAATYEAGLYYWTASGFEKQSSAAFKKDKGFEDLDALIFDANGNGYNDIYVVSGGNEFDPDSEMLQDRLYINDGKGNFTRDLNALPKMHDSGSRVYKADFDKDGKEELLVLGRLVPGNYPSPANSYILKNNSKNGKVSFKDITQSIAPFLTSLGMATSAEIVDIDNDGWKDIIIVGEWMPIKIFRNNKTEFKDVSKKMGITDDTAGWWWSIKKGDFDNDGDQDFIVGNLGKNYKYTASEDATFDIYFKDFDGNNNNDIVLSYYNEGEKFPLRGRECSSQQIPGIKEKFPDYESFSTATLEEVYSEKDLENSLHYQVKSFSSIYLENADGKFKIHELPNVAQISSINQILVKDYDNDGHLDALIAGNLFWSEVETTRNDAGYGMFLKGDGTGNFEEVVPAQSGFFLPGDVKDMETIKVENREIIIAVKNNSPVQYIGMKNQ
ncbi:FG-GAP-like repeat-containing protein [Salegentibacter salegens]|uniref:FG-GAP repeat-containing protein n=1 Tax=Salegentibacter salegens TaxID=143223 RepID=A0A1M7N8N6_9FLAO|nr:FG-GAP-like repeat-containing protein [Salegentibacter salegens]PRX45697.1 FG-GAP repeat protein [Salegentibacter salegens]SHM99949.1 FG-GAP repeat-containing protein [Salegentibacter salegens]